MLLEGRTRCMIKRVLALSQAFTFLHSTDLEITVHAHTRFTMSLSATSNGFRPLSLWSQNSQL